MWHYSWILAVGLASFTTLDAIWLESRDHRMALVPAKSVAGRHGK